TATKECYENGTWAPAVYNACVLETNRKEHPFDDMYTTKTVSVRLIYDVGFSVTTVVLILALAIFLNFRSLRCLRNSIHCNLIMSFIFSNITWLTVHNTLNEVTTGAPKWVCKLFMAAITYFHTVPFYWMFVEGLYLFTIVVWAFSAQKIRLWYYMIIGWVTPFFITVAWVVMKETYDEKTCWLHSGTSVDYIIHGPVFLFLATNVFFIVAIIWVLVTKMKASNTLETRQSRKAVRATVVLVPLLGLTYILFIKPPFDDRILNSIFQHVNALLQSTQGLLVAIFYCFLNGEVRSLLRQRLNALQDSRTLSRYTKSSFFGSPRRSSCYAVALTTCNGKGVTPKGSVNSKGSRVGETETEASALMIEKVGNTSEVTPLSDRLSTDTNV
ncbi:unnamed protein product, partial [Candidula unifasciata]